ncbi:MAG: hypothetical protein QHJ81_12295 [Anaerolineae bacterium]|nr:hypothetical protein [Anaerolineae bacterium]
MTSRQLSGLMLGIALLSWGGLGYVVLTQSPSALTEALFFPLLFLAVASVTVPGLAWLRHRLGKEDEPGVVLRQGIWFGLAASICAGLQLARMLDAAIVAVVVAFFALLEVFLLERPERWRSLWYEQIIRRRDSRGKGQEARGKKQEARGRKQEARGKGQEARSKRQEAGGKRQDARGRK